MMGDRPMHGHISNLPSGEAIHPAPMGPERQIQTIWRSECSVCIDTAIAAVKLYDGEVSAGWSCETKPSAKRPSTKAKRMFISSLMTTPETPYLLKEADYYLVICIEL